MSAFQAEDAGSIPATRSTKNVLRPLAEVIFCKVDTGIEGQGGSPEQRSEATIAKLDLGGEAENVRNSRYPLQ